MRLLTLTALIAAAAMASCTNSEAPTQAAPGTDNSLTKTISEKYHNSGTIYNSCCDEDMYFEADIHQTFSDETDKKGVQTVKAHVNTGTVVLTGLTSGLKYTGSQIDKETVVWQPSGCPATHTYTSRFRAVATGSGQGKNDCSFVLKVTFKESLDADCNYSVDVDDVTIECE